MTTHTSVLPTHAETAGPIDAARWPDVARVPHSPLRAAVARRVTISALRRLPLRLLGPSGALLAGGGGHADPTISVHRPDAFFSRLGRDGLIGLGESYMAGEWDSDDLAGCFTVLASGVGDLVPPSLARLRAVALPRRRAGQSNGPEEARANAAHHYDLSNELFSLFLDPTLSYSAALFDGHPRSVDEPLAEAQRRKIDRLLDETGVGPGSQVLEIGTGWGALAIRAAQRGATVTTITLSVEQARVARQRISAAGCSARVDVLVCDYRQVAGQYDVVLSVEMIEAVGQIHWATYFSTVARLLRPGGRFGLQAITMAHDRMLATQDTHTWMLKYIFPGGQIPSEHAIRQHAAAVGLVPDSALAFGQHYAETLGRWQASFEAAHAEVSALGFDEAFRRMWRLYLAYSEAGFASGYLDVVQIIFTRQVAEPVAWRDLATQGTAAPQGTVAA